MGRIFRDGLYVGAVRGPHHMENAPAERRNAIAYTAIDVAGPRIPLGLAEKMSSDRSIDNHPDSSVRIKERHRGRTS